MTDGRFMLLGGVYNFRDYGGYAVSNGGKLRSGLLYRSGQHSHATDDDLVRISAVPLSTIVDLRGSWEREAYPCRRTAGFSGEVLFDDTVDTSLPPHLQGDLANLSADRMRELTEGTYRRLPFEPNILATLAIYFDALSRGEGANLIHCFAGKDRTGIAVALFHSLMGVHADDIMQDYLLTNHAGDRTRQMQYLSRILKERWGEISQEGLYVLSSVYPEWLDAAFAAIRERYGSIDAFLKDTVGVDSAKRDAIAARVLTD